MKLSLNWLKDYIDPKLKDEDLIHRLVMAGWEVEAVETVGKDTVFELEITPNRPDCLNVLGLAREISAITGRNVTFPKIKNYKDTAKKISISIEEKKDCSRYVGTLIENVTVKDAPDNIQTRLNSLGIRPISNVVDVTNFVLMETGQPLHAFDYDKIVGGKVIIRRAKTGEKIITIDGVERLLDPTVLVIADTVKPIAIAGIMGGKETEVTVATKNILLESASFDMGLIRRASRKLGLRSDSSYRFERSVDWRGVLTGANRATDLLLNLTKGQLAARRDVAYTPKGTQYSIKVTTQEVENLLGLKVPLAKIKSILTSLDFKVSGKGASLIVVPPSFRGDIKQSVDLVEEVARTIGFDHMPTSLPQIKAKNLIVDQRPAMVKKSVREALMASGVDEIVTLSMTNTKDLKRCLQQNLKVVRVFNPLTIDQELMRPSLLPSFLGVVAGNFNRGQKDLRLFEIAKKYLSEGEKEVLTILLTGSRYQDWRLSRKDQVQFCDLKGVLKNVYSAVGIEAAFSLSQEDFLDESCASHIEVKGEVVGVAGRLKATVLQNWDIKHQDVFFAEIDLQKLFKTSFEAVAFKPLVEFPAAVRDISLAVKKEASYGAIEALCRQKGGDILVDVQFIEQYLGDKIQPDQKGLVFSCLYQSHTRTLREEEVNTAHQSIIQALTNELGATLR
ncbi:MAG: phenylalanine--tRNA ligase subunit beta [Candidatus Omnitrophota bacterium]